MHPKGPRENSCFSGGVFWYEGGGVVRTFFWGEEGGRQVFLEGVIRRRLFDSDWRGKQV